MNRITTVQIEGFKSIRHLERLEIGPVNLLIGPNGAGKSNFIGFFQFLSHIASENLQRYVQIHGFADSFLHLGSKITSRIRGELEFGGEEETIRYGLSLIPAAGDTLVFAEECLSSCGNGNPEPIEFDMEAGGKESALVNSSNVFSDREHIHAAQDVRDVLSRKRVYQFHDTTPESRLRKAAPVDDHRFLRPDGGNLPAVLFGMRRNRPEFYRRIVLQLRRMIRGFRDFELAPEGDYILLRWRGSDPDYTFGPHQISDGSLRLMALSTLFLQPPEALPNMIIVDEPELGLHPEAEALLAGMIRGVSSRCQVLLATQSASFVDHFEADDVVVCDMEDSASRFRRLSRTELDGWLEDYTLGEVWRKNAIGGLP